MAFKSIWSSASLMAIHSLPHSTDEGAVERLDSRNNLHVVFLDEDKGVQRVVDCSRTSYGDLVETLKKALSFGPIYMAIDTYMFLSLYHEMIDDSAIAGVFPFPADDVCDRMPSIVPSVDRTCRKVARYYYALFQKYLIDWNGKVTRFRYKASNTRSYRAYASYQMVKRELRATVRPAHPDARVLQFDWAAAEWTLILQHLGYQPQQDAYEVFTACGIDRDAAKKIVLPKVYGALMDTLYQAAVGEGRDTSVVDAVVTQMNTQYPLVLEWSDRMRHTSVVDFEGYLITLGDEPYKRPNRWAQTALQLCKWDLIERIVDRGLQGYGAGDLHDQLYFDFVPTEPASMAGAAALIEEIQRPVFGRYKLPAKLDSDTHWK